MLSAGLSAINPQEHLAMIRTPFHPAGPGRFTLFGLLACVLLPWAAHAQDAPPRPKVHLIPVTGVVEMGLAPFVERGIREAVDMGASAVILDMDTPGGRVDSAERIVQALADSPIPVYTLVNRHAYSAGAMIAMATHTIFMRPGAVMGAATPVDGSGKKASEKMVSAMRSQMRALAEVRGLDPAVAEAMVDEDVAIEGLVEEGKLLTLTVEEAVAIGYAESAEDLTGLLIQLDLGRAEVVDVRVNWAERMVRFLSHPIVAPFLLSLGFLGLIAEIKTPGLGLAGLAGIVSLGLFFGSHLLIGLAGLEDLLIVGAGLVFLLVEGFVIPGFGIFGVVGIAAVFGGLFMTQLPGLPTQADFARAGAVITTSLILVVVTAWALLRHLPKSGRLNRTGVFLNAATDKEHGFTSASVRADLLGMKGRAITDLRPAGVGVFGDERVDIVSESEWIEEGSPVEVIASEGYRHVVRVVAED
jgi:membrane-bound serine protease (ClpP class)